MIRHTPDTMTLRRYSKFEKSKDLRVLFRVPVPKWYAIRYSGQFVKEFNQLFNGNSEGDQYNEFIRLSYQNKIMLMQTLMMGVQMHLGDKIQLDMLRPGYDAHMSIDPVLAHYITEIEQCCDIKIESIEDIIAFRNELERKIDKYNELFPVKEVKTTGISMLQLAFSVFSLLNMPANIDITLSEFAEMKQLADDRAKKMQDSIEKSKRNG